MTRTTWFWIILIILNAIIWAALFTPSKTGGVG